MNTSLSKQTHLPKEGLIRIGGKEYHCNINNKGERFISGMSIDAFMDTLTFDELLEMAMLGERVAKKTIKTSPHVFVDALQKGKQKN